MIDFIQLYFFDTVGVDPPEIKDSRPCIDNGINNLNVNQGLAVNGSIDPPLTVNGADSDSPELNLIPQGNQDNNTQIVAVEHSPAPNLVQQWNQGNTVDSNKMSAISGLETPTANNVSGVYDTRYEGNRSRGRSNSQRQGENQNSGSGDFDRSRSRSPCRSRSREPKNLFIDGKPTEILTGSRNSSAKKRSNVDLGRCPRLKKVNQQNQDKDRERTREMQCSVALKKEGKRSRVLPKDATMEGNDDDSL